MKDPNTQNDSSDPADAKGSPFSRTMPITVLDLEDQAADMYLHIRLDEQKQPQRVPLAREPYTIGRDQSADIPIMAPSVSRRHARLFFLHGEEIIEDLGSTNGVLVNGVRVSHCVLQDKDLIHIGDVTLLFTRSHTAQNDKE